MTKTRKIAVFYRDLPHALEVVARRSERLSFNKDGVYKVGEISAPRATVTIQWDGTTEDKILFEKTIAFLEELEANNQIISFSVK